MTLSRRKLTPITATDESIAPFGRLIRAQDDSGRQTKFYNDAVSLWNIPGMVTDHDASVSVTRISPRPMSVIWMERHFKHTQVFMPLNGAPFHVVMAPPNADMVPDPEHVQALSFDGSAGLMLHLRTWHEFPFAVDREADVAVFLRNETNANLDAFENGEAIGGDLEKRNIQTRLGIEFVI